MNIQARLVAGLFIILAILASYFATYRYGKHVEFLKQDNIRKEAIIKSAKENDALKLVLQQEKTNAENALNALLDRPAGRVRLPTRCSQSNPAGGEPQTLESDRILSEQIERILSEGRQRIQGIVGEAEQELIECRVVKDWAARIPVE